MEHKGAFSARLDVSFCSFSASTIWCAALSVWNIPDKATGLEKAFRLLDSLLRFAYDGLMSIECIVRGADYIRQFLQFKNRAHYGVLARRSSAQSNGKFFLLVVDIKTCPAEFTFAQQPEQDVGG